MTNDPPVKSDSVASGEWRIGGDQAAYDRLIAAGVDFQSAQRALAALQDMIVVSPFYVPTSDELFSQYGTLGYAYLRGRIDVRWVMCAETHDALWRRYNTVRYPVPDDRIPFVMAEVSPSPELVAFEVRTVMERNRKWTEPGQLFGIPIRIDPAARTPMFEIIKARPQ